jgi:DNA-binding FadR family transcriptional regulator
LTPRQFGDMAKLHLQMADATYDELVHARLAIEPLMARLAATNVDEAAALRLNEAVEHARSVDLDDGEAYLSVVSHEFHATIAGIANNRVLDLFAVALKEVMDSGVRPAFQFQEERALVVKVHEKIAAAVLAGRPEEAEELMREHMQEFVDQVEATRPGFLRSPIEWTLAEPGL